MINRILVPLDGSALAECVIPHVRAVANAFDSQVTLMTVLDPSKGINQETSIDPLEWQIQKAEADNYLQEVANQLQETGIRVESILLEGKAEKNIINFVHSNDINLIILSSHGQSGLSGWNVSSVVQKIIIRAYTSVMIVRAYQTVSSEVENLQYRLIMVPLDGSQRAESVLPVVATLSRHHKSNLLMVHVVHRPEVPRRTPLSQEDIELVERLTERNRIEASRYLDDVQGRFSSPVQTRLLVNDRITASLQNIVEQEKVDLILLSAHGYSGEMKWPYGSVVIGFIAYGTTPLMIIQDVPKDRLGETQAEIAAREYGRR